MNHVDRGDQLRSYYAYDHPLRRGPWQALCWTFLLDVALINSYIAQLRGPQPNWKRYTTQREWRVCIYNALFNTYHEESQSRKRYRAGDESDFEIPQKEHLLVRQKMRSDCFACQGFRQGQVRSKGQKRRPLGEDGGNARRRQTDYWCSVCTVLLCNNGNCWYFYHIRN
jgi:hypothetical protein